MLESENWDVKTYSQDRAPKDPVWGIKHRFGVFGRRHRGCLNSSLRQPLSKV